MRRELNPKDSEPKGEDCEFTSDISPVDPESATDQRDSTGPNSIDASGKNIQHSLSGLPTSLTGIANLQRSLIDLSPPLTGFANLRKPLIDLNLPLTGFANLRKPLIDLNLPLTGFANLRKSFIDLNPPLTGFANLWKSLIDLNPPLTGFAKLRKSLIDLNLPLTGFAELQRSFSHLNPTFLRYADVPFFSFPRIHNIIRPFELLRNELRILQFEKAGWFPHGTFPTELLQENLSEIELDEKVLDYYRENWTEVHQCIEDELSGCLVDTREKDVFRQALMAHSSGLYDLVSPALFSQVERVVRVHLYENKIGHISVVKEMRGRLTEFPSSALPDGLVGYIGFDIFTRLLYANIKTETERERFSNIAIPNRHAVIHGLLDYESEKNSLNSIFIASYAFQLITAIKIEETKKLISEIKM